MAAETKRAEHTRLQKRTDELKSEHADLSRDKTPFDQADHDEHTAHLAKHKKDLRSHQRRKKD
jgi:hypothetical protein